MKFTVICYTHFGPNWPEQPCHWCDWVKYWNMNHKPKKTEQYQKSMMEHLMSLDEQSAR